MRALNGLTEELGPKPGAGPRRRLATLAASAEAKSAVVRYGLAVVSFALCLLLAYALRLLFSIKFDPTTLVVIVLIASAWYLGRGPGLLVAILYEATIDFFSPDPIKSPIVIFNRLILFVSLALFASACRRALRGRELLLERERAARAEAEDANRHKDEFLATVSHELRTPLTAILGWAAMLNSGGMRGEATRNALEAIERNARAQAGIVNDILDVSRVITGKFHIDPQPVDLAPLVRSSVNALHPAAAAKGIAISVSLDQSAGLVAGDPDRLQQITWNLLSNAIKFTPEGGSVEVSLRRADSYLELGVSDTGIGISGEFLPHVFERFRQADSSITRAHGGLGLGLSIVRHLAELHGGTVRAESPGVGRGASFTVRLPAASARGSLALPPGGDGAAGLVRAGGDGDVTADAPDLTDLRVLVVDDEPDTLEVICAVLNRHGAEVRAAGSSGEALKALAGWRPDVLVSDLGMPDEDGFALIGKVRSLAPGRGGDVPAAALTAYVRDEDRRRALAAGFQTHIAKPVDPAALAAAVAGLAKRSKVG